MNVIFAKSNWEAYNLPLREFIERVRLAKFDATEIFLPGRHETISEIATLHTDFGVKLIAQINTTGKTPSEHLLSLERNFNEACKANPVFVNCHTGRDIFTFAENLQLFNFAQKLSLESGVKIRHETHRGRALFSAPATRDYLKAVPDLQLTADFSHWFCVHESDLLDQPENMAVATQAAHHIHARVGFREGPQVGDPLSPVYKPWLDLHTALWKAIIDLRNQEGQEWLSITPEFGPPLYMPLGANDLPVADPWTLNLWMRDYLTKTLNDSL